MKTLPLLRTLGIVAAATLLALVPPGALAQGGPGAGQKWAATWSSSMLGALTYTPPDAPVAPNTVGSANVQPDLTFPFPNINTDGASDQTFRTIIKPDLWGKTMRVRFNNFFGTQPVTFSRVTIGLQAYAANLVPGTLVSVTFNGGQTSLTVQPGQLVYSDAVVLPFDTANPLIQGRNLSVSYAVQGTTGKMTYHSAAHQTNYVTGSGTGNHASDISGYAFDYTTTSFFFLDCADVVAPADTAVVCGFGDSITDGTHTTVNGNDRWTNVLSRKIHRSNGNNTVSVVNEGIGGNTVINPPRTGPPAVDRLDRDVLGLSGLTHVIWLEGINDVAGGYATDDIIAGYKNVVARLRARGIKVIGGTLTSALSNPTRGAPGDVKRRILNDFIRTPGNFDAVADFDAATLDPATGDMAARFLPNSEFSQLPLDYLHPNHAGYNAMGLAVNLALVGVHPAFFTGEAALGTSGVYYLAFPNGNVFGYYSFAFFPYLYHFDLGFEYFIDANDGSGNAYLYDFASGTFFFTGPKLWPYLYDFKLNAWLYYFPATNQPGRYSSNPRRFFNFATNSVITK